jgi:hypothetical protein
MRHGMQLSSLSLSDWQISLLNQHSCQMEAGKKYSLKGTIAMTTFSTNPSHISVCAGLKGSL